MSDKPDFSVDELDDVVKALATYLVARGLPGTEKEHCKVIRARFADRTTVEERWAALDDLPEWCAVLPAPATPKTATTEPPKTAAIELPKAAIEAVGVVDAAFRAFYEKKKMPALLQSFLRLSNKYGLLCRRWMVEIIGLDGSGAILSNFVVSTSYEGNALVTWVERPVGSMSRSLVGIGTFLESHGTCFAYDAGSHVVIKCLV